MELIINNFFKYIIISILILFSSQSMAASVLDAINANKNNNAKEAVKIWTQLADTGSAVAQYNLASHYITGKGIEKNKLTADKWLKAATRSGLVQAYLKLNKQAIASARGMSIKFNVGPVFWLNKQEPDRYTIQLSSSRNEESIKKSYNENNLRGKGGYYHYIHNGVDRYALVSGVYNSVAEANEAIALLPEQLRKKTPWVRKIKSLQNISK